MAQSPVAGTVMSGEMDKPLISRRLVDSDGSLAEVPKEAPKVGILGSGDFARSLATRLVGSGFSVVVGSRNPKRTAGLFPSLAQVTFQEEAVSSPEVIFVAMFREHYSSLCSLADQLAGKILVDVSNPTEKERLQHHQSNAEYLASLFPACTVVKAFNVISAWALQAGPRDGNRQVLICGDQLEAKHTVSEMARAMGFTPLDMGSLASAREVEAIPLRLLPSWKVPTLLALGLFVCFYAYNFIRDVLQPYIRKDENKFYKMPLSVVNTTLPCVAYVLLSLVYLPGVLAAALQLRRGTKYQRFPDWLDHWLQHRKQIGLLSFFFAMLHALYSFCLPLRRSNRYDLVNLAVKQSTLGFVALMLSTMHTLTYGWTRAFEENHYKFYLPPTFTLTLLLPCVIILAKGLFLLPCLSHRLAKIRRGWERDGAVKFMLPAGHTQGEKTSHV
ncbi:metalloreductase STEAP3 isoform X3 [Rattus rattus]|uniref:metalloreductase STEAP3 isoform X3 n=1 Tax=Rattus rattus TaxID=10117 RepID=UPI0013F387E2|nr:metalloreductase STEAP3 isoform X3 [Rattus rattus]